MFRIQQFATLSGVTVRTLHHYDRLGLLSPALRSESGYRLYGEGDFRRLERILVLRYLGLPLREIAELLEKRQQNESLETTLTRQMAVLRERRNGIDRLLQAIETAREQTKAEPEWLLCQNILKEIGMQNEAKWTDSYYTPEARESVRASASNWNPEMQAQVTAEWQGLYAEVQSALDRGVEPASDEGRGIAARWMELVGRFTGGRPEVLEGLNKLYADRANWPADAMSEEQKAMLPKPEYMAFVRAAQGR